MTDHLPARGAADAPAVSVVIPCYNLGAYVTDAIDSVLGQTRQDFEIVVVNDGSTDPETNRILSALERPRTRVLTTPNRGLPAARNLAIRHASGRYICALDADDLLHPEFLEKTLAPLDADPAIAFVSTWAECFGEGETWVWRQEQCGFPRLLAECVVLTASPVRRSILDEVGGYDERADFYGSEDWDLWISIVERGHRGVIVPEALFRYRQRAESMRRVASRPPIRDRVWHALLDKHAPVYALHARDVLLQLEAECGHLLRENRALERDLAVRLEPLVRNRRAVLAGSRPEDHASPPAAAPPPAENPVAIALAEVRALRSSRSWRMTAPLRRLYDLWMVLARGRSGGAGA